MNPSRELIRNPPPATTRLLTSHLNEKELTIGELWNVVLRRKMIVIGALVFFVGGATIFCAISTRLYKATGEVQVQKEDADALGWENMSAPAEAESDALDANLTLETQAKVLESDSLALQVIKELNLEQNADFRPTFNPIESAVNLLSPSGLPDPKDVPLESAPGRRTRALKIFERRLKVEPVSGTRLIEVSYLNSDPKVAADVVNHLVHDLIEFNFQTRHNATHEAAGWLGNQLFDLRKQSEDLQAKVVGLQHDSGVFTLGQTDTQGREEVYAPVLDRLQQATSQLAQAESARIMKGALYQVVKDGDPELISNLSGSGMLAAASQGVNGSLALIQNLRAQEATAQSQLNELSAKFGPGYPKVAEVAASLESTQNAIHAEAERVAARAKNDYNIAEQVENGARTVFLKEKRQADSLNDKTIEYEIVRQEAMQSRSLYESLLRRLKEVDLLSGLRSSDITLVNPGLVPSKPARPNVPLYLAISLAGGLFMGICGALFRDATDTKIQTLPELEAYFGEIPFGILPYHRTSRGSKLAAASIKSFPAPDSASILAPLKANPISANSLAAVIEPRAPYTEAVRILRTSLMRGNGGPPPKVILITSSVSGEGKSMLSVNLAIVLAQQGKKVLLVDGDLRTPVLHRRLNLKTDTGLSSLLATDAGIHPDVLSVAIPMNGMAGLHVMAAGPVSPHPAELLGSNKMAEVMHVLREEYDFIIMDGAPVLPVTDSVLLSTHADLTLVVARYEMTERQSLERSCSILQSQGAHKLGLVMNAIKRSGTDYNGCSNYRYEGETNA
jgi:capsular exopolysaccharide synthesis family protein